MRAASWFLALLLLLALCRPLLAAVAPVTVRAPQTQAWTGQRVAFFVELRTRGSFAGSPRFELPQIPGSVVIKIGTPVVGSQEIDGESWMVQTHEFALFSQASGVLEVPAFGVRFGSREGFTGPVSDVLSQASGWRVDIRRPPGSEAIGFLVSTPALEIGETWEPQPGDAQVGAVFKRRIVQRAQSVSGIALEPAALAAPDGIRVYRGNEAVEDHLERGEFLGERRETLTYLLQQPGSVTLPALSYSWWNPDAQALESATLPAVSFEVSRAPATLATGAGVRRAWPWLLLAGVLAGAALRWRQEVAARAIRAWRLANPPQRAAARRVLLACRGDDAAAAWAAWLDWCAGQAVAFRPCPELAQAIEVLERQLFSRQPPQPWNGEGFARAFAVQRAVTKTGSASERGSVLPALNP